MIWTGIHGGSFECVVDWFTSRFYEGVCGVVVLATGSQARDADPGFAIRTPSKAGPRLETPFLGLSVESIHVE